MGQRARSTFEAEFALNVGVERIENLLAGTAHATVD
jgi:hypothetical protein